MFNQLYRKKRLTSFQIIILGFAGIILLGAFLLMLPISSRSGIITPFHEALFTATSAVCVTGLIVQDTASYWSPIGQGIILILIQIGGMGVITVAASFALLAGKKMSLKQRSTMQEALAAPKTGGIGRLTSFIIKATFLIELIGAIVMMPVFVQEFGLKGIWMAIFHSISAFCNAGFDIMGTLQARFVSLTAYHNSWIINLTIMTLIIVGGIGFLTWNDIKTNKHHFKRYRMQSKVILVTSFILIAFPALYFYFYEFTNLQGSDRILSSLFQAVTPRTAGFNTVDLSMVKGTSQFIIIALMLIGGSPGSTAGGMKTTTVAVLLANTMAVFTRKKDAQMFKRRISSDVVRNAATILMMYLALFLSSAFIISIVEDLPMSITLFETASAVGTVGLSLGLTPSLGILSQCILIALMFFGRVGGLTLIYATLSGINMNVSKLPQETITVG